MKIIQEKARFMSTFLRTDTLTGPIENVEDLKGYFQRFAKPKGEERVGIECELFGVDSQTGEALPFSGARGIEAVLNRLAYEFGYETIHEKDHVIALQRGSTMISLEPGGQVELSAEPTRSIHQAKAQLDEFFLQLRTVGNSLGSIAWLASGIHPFSSLQDIEWVPKQRYEIMAKYLGGKGKKAHDMMKRTATNQINFDYHNEEDAIEKMRLVLALTPVASAMFANSSFSQGGVGSRVSERLNIWRFTDPERCGLIIKLICEHCKFDDYLKYLLHVPMMFIVRGDKWIVTHDLTFQKFIEDGYQGLRPTETDFELHLSTIFTDARFKQYLEMRGIDGQRKHLIPAVYAFWKGILYDEEAKMQTKKLISRFRERELQTLHYEVEQLGLKAQIQGTSALDLARALVSISEEGLRRQKNFNEREQDERIYLTPLKEEILKEGVTPAEQVARLWNGSLQRNRRALIDYMKV